jgi:hypothetical protein
MQQRTDMSHGDVEHDGEEDVKDSSSAQYCISDRHHPQGVSSFSRHKAAVRSLPEQAAQQLAQLVMDGSGSIWIKRLFEINCEDLHR